ncbi:MULTISPECIES: phage tail protein [unclassified Aerococcus]|uniref:phage tail-collar fiber domain-containing protein n=1 Tax=unclassified Aerococcus TaxID=2618060 RepID=UPI0025C12702|nr:MULTISPECIES: phage tail protein [unclassified Aerococcus]
MAEFKRVVITRNGQTLMAKLMSGTGTVEFTKIGVSSTTYTDTQLESLTSLSGVKQTAPITNIARNNNASVTVEGAISNEELAVGYYMQTIGLFAKDPDVGEILYAVTNASVAGYMPPFNNRTPSGAQFKLTTTVGNAENVTLQIDPSAVATIGDINRLETSLNDLQAYVGYAEKGVLGLEADFENNKFTRLGDAEGRTPGASFDGFNMYGGRRRVNLADNGTVNAVFGDGGYKEDGSNGQVMVEQPVFYYKVVPLKTQPNADGHGQNLMKARYYVSDQPRAGFKVHPAFKDHNGKVRQKVYVSAYESAIFDTSEGVYLKLDEQVADFASDKLSSIANAKPASGLTQNLTRENARKLANNRGQGWHQQTLATASMSQLLFIIEYASFNTQENLGSGRTGVADDGATSQTSNTGATQTLGNKSGSVDADGYAIPTYRGEENLWGNIFSIVDGFTLEGKGKHNGWYALGDYRENGIDGSYKPFGFTIAKSNGYIKYFGYSEDADFAFIPGATNGGANSALPIGDYLYQNNAYDNFLVARLGGYWSGGADAGLFHWYLNGAFSNRYRSFGARLVYAP